MRFPEQRNETTAGAPGLDCPFMIRFVGRNMAVVACHNALEHRIEICASLDNCLRPVCEADVAIGSVRNERLDDFIIKN